MLRIGHIQLGLHYLFMFKESSNEDMYKGGMYDVSLHAAGALVCADLNLLQVGNLQDTSGFRKPWGKLILEH